MIYIGFKFLVLAVFFFFFEKVEVSGHWTSSFICLLIISNRVKMPCFWICYSLNRNFHLINTELVAMLSATAFVAQLAEHLTRFAGSRVRFPTGRPEVAFLQQVPAGSKSRGICALEIFLHLFTYIYIYIRKRIRIHIHIRIRLRLWNLTC